MLERIKGLAAEIEATYATDPTIVEASDSIQTRNLQVSPLDGDFINRDLDRAALGAEGDILVSQRVLLGFEIEAVGAGGAVDAPPAYNDILRACGLGETINAATSVVYAPVSSGFESAWIEANTDGIQHVCKGARGNMSMNWTTRDIPRFLFAMQGLRDPATDVVTPTYDYSNFAVPFAFNNANTGTFTLAGQAVGCEAVSIDFQNDIQHRDIIGSEEILLVDRNVRGTISFASTLLATYDWFADVAARTTGVLNIVHGTGTGRTLTINCPIVELSNPTYSESQGQLMLNMDMIIRPSSSGDDEITFTFT